MPNIVEINPTGQTLQPNEAAANVAREKGYIENRFARETGQALGRGVSAALRPVGQALDKLVDDAERHETFAQISHASTIYASLFGDTLAKWRKVASESDPNDTSIMQGFKEHVLEPSLEQFLKSSEALRPEAQRWTLSRADTFREQMTHTMIADMGTRQYAAVHKNKADLERTWSQTVALNPEKLPLAIETIKSDFEEQIKHAPYLKPGDAERIRAEVVPDITKKIARAAAFGMARSNPEALASAIAEGKFDYLDAEDQARATNLAREALNHRRSDENHAYELRQREKRETSELAVTGYINQILRGQTVVAEKLSFDPKVLPHEKENIIHFQDSFTKILMEKKDKIPHPEMVHSLRSQLFITARDDPNNLYRVLRRARDEFIAGNLNPSESDHFEQRFAAIDKPMERNYASQLATAERFIKASSFAEAMSKGDPAWAANLINQIDRDAYAKLDAARQAKESLTPLLNPRDPNYLFSPAVLNSYFSSPKAEIGAQADKIRKGPTTTGQIGGPPTKGVVEHNGYRFPNQAALDAYLKAGGK